MSATSKHVPGKVTLTLLTALILRNPLPPVPKLGTIAPKLGLAQESSNASHSGFIPASRAILPTPNCKNERGRMKDDRAAAPEGKREKAKGKRASEPERSGGRDTGRSGDREIEQSSRGFPPPALPLSRYLPLSRPHALPLSRNFPLSRPYVLPLSRNLPRSRGLPIPVMSDE